MERHTKVGVLRTQEPGLTQSPTSRERFSCWRTQDMLLQLPTWQHTKKIKSVMAVQSTFSRNWICGGKGGVKSKHWRPSHSQPGPLKSETHNQESTQLWCGPELSDSDTGPPGYKHSQEGERLGCPRKITEGSTGPNQGRASPRRSDTDRSHHSDKLRAINEKWTIHKKYSETRGRVQGEARPSSADKKTPSGAGRWRWK